MLTVLNRQKYTLTAFFSGKDINLVEQGSSGRFYPEDPSWGSFNAVVEHVEQLGEASLDNLYLASLFGGDIAVREGENSELLTVESIHKVNFKVPTNVKPDRILRGTIVLDRSGTSLFQGVYRKVHQLFRQELDF